MNILAFDTSTAACSVALSCNNQIYSDHIIQARGHANLLLGMIESLLISTEIALTDIDLISFGQGPGSFTGLRIAAGVCQGIAYSHDIRVIALSSLQVLAQSAYRETGKRNIAVLQDARMSEIYWGCYTENDGIMNLINQENVSKPELIQLDKNINWYSVGEAWLAYQDKLDLGDSLMVNEELIYPNAIDMIVLAKKEFEKGNSIQADDINPVYIRNNVASTKK